MESEFVTQSPKRSSRIRHKAKRYGFLITNDKGIILVDHNEPITYQDAIVDPNSIRWHEAMKSEIKSMYDNQVWNLVDPSVGAKVIDCKWIYKLKADEIFKARLVARF